MDMATKIKFKKETDSLQIATQNNAIRTKYVKTKIDNMQQNNECRLCGNKDETTDPIISEISILTQKKYKSRHNLVGKVIHWELCKKMKFDHTTE